MALASYALTTAQKARSYVKRVPTDNSADPLLETLINAYSKAIINYVEREFKPKTDDATRVFRYDNGGYLSLAPYDLRSVTTVTLYSDLPTSSQDVLDPQSDTIESEYRLEPRQGTPEGTYLWMVLPNVTRSAWRRARVGQVSILGNWGMNETPADVELACLIAVANSYRNPEGFASRSLGELSFTEADTAAAVGGAQSLPPDARALLGPYKRNSF